MKQLLLFLICFLFLQQTIAQYTQVPDPNFEQALIDIGIDSEGTLDGQFLTTDAENVTITAQDSTAINNQNLIQNLDSGLYKIEKNYDDGSTQETVIYKENN